MCGLLSCTEPSKMQWAISNVPASLGSRKDRLGSRWLSNVTSMIGLKKGADGQKDAAGKRRVDELPAGPGVHFSGPLAWRHGRISASIWVSGRRNPAPGGRPVIPAPPIHIYRHLGT